MADEEKKPSVPIEGEKDNILKTRTILLSSGIDKDVAEKVVRQLLMLEADDENKPIWIFINSPGGEVYSGFAIYDVVRFIKCPVYMLGIGLVASAASLIYLAVPKERRYALKNSTYLIHQPLASMKGNATDIEIYADKLNKTKERLNSIIAEATGKNIEDVVVDTDRDYWMTADEAKEYGLVTNIVTSRNEIQQCKQNI